MMQKICPTMAFLCFTLLVQPNSIKARQDSNSRYLLVELDGSPDMDPGSDVTTEEPEMPKPEEDFDDDFYISSDDLEPETLPAGDEGGTLPEIENQPARKRNLNANASAAQQGGYRSIKRKKTQNGYRQLELIGSFLGVPTHSYRDCQPIVGNEHFEHDIGHRKTPTFAVWDCIFWNAKMDQQNIVALTAKVLELEKKIKPLVQTPV